MRRWVAIVAFCVPTLGHAEAEEMGTLLERCAPQVHKTTMGGIVAAESGGNPLALVDNDRIGKPRSQRMVRSFRPQTREEAVQIASALIAAGHSVDLGPGQVNSRNMRWLGLSVSDLFDPCRNLGASASVLVGFYEAAARAVGPGAKALGMALSAYNTGNFRDGFSNGYVERVRAAAKRGMPVLRVQGPFRGGSSVVVVGSSGRASHGVLTRRPSLLEAKLAGVDIERF